MPAASAPKFALDTSVLIAVVAAWHENHERAVRAVDARLKAGWKPLVPAHVLLEAFAVLTRLPAPFRVKPDIARMALASAFPECAVEVTPGDCFQAMQTVERMSLAGGKVYDAAIAESSIRSGARLLMTFDAGDYLHVRPPALEIAIPE